jgi:hypothetical protein
MVAESTAFRTPVVERPSTQDTSARRFTQSAEEPLSSAQWQHFNLTVKLQLKAIVRGFSWTTMPITWQNRRGEAEDQGTEQPLLFHRRVRLAQTSLQPRRLLAARCRGAMRRPPVKTLRGPNIQVELTIDNYATRTEFNMAAD